MGAKRSFQSKPDVQRPENEKIRTRRIYRHSVLLRRSGDSGISNSLRAECTLRRILSTLPGAAGRSPIRNRIVARRGLFGIC
eukprot:6112069-Pyramimonas_sp.AAC.2